MHVIERRPELVRLIEELLETIECPEAITPDPLTGRWRYWRSGIGPTRWVKVVVAWEEGPPWIVTAFPTRRNGRMSSKHFAPPLSEPIVVCGVRLTHASYDERGDHLYLTKGVPLGPADGDTREGHAVFLDQSDRVICVILNGARWHLDHDDTIDVTLRDGGPTTRLPRELVEPLLRETLSYT